MWLDGKTEHKGVAVIVCRHEKPASTDITGYGAGYAYLVGKLLSDYVGVSYPEHIFYSPIARARHTAQMHELAMKVNDIVPPSMSYDASFHESASPQKVKEAFTDALTFAEASNMKTIEIVGHEPTLNIIRQLMPSQDFGKMEYGAALVIKADSWEDLRRGKCTVEGFESSHKFAEAALGKEQTEILDDLMYHGSQTGGSVTLSPDLKQKDEKQCKMAAKWIEQVEKVQAANGQTSIFGWLKPKQKVEMPESRYSPIEYLEVFDAYKAWVDMSMSVVGISPDQKGFLYSELYQRLKKDNPDFDEFATRVDQGDRNPDNESYAVFNAVAKLLTKGKEVVSDAGLEKMEDFPMYRDMVMAGEGRTLSGDKEVKVEKAGSYRVTQKEQQAHDEVARIVRNFKDLQR